MELQDDVLQSQHHLLRDEDTVVELVKLKAELPQKGLRLRGTELRWLVGNAGSIWIIKDGRGCFTSTGVHRLQRRLGCCGEN